MALNILSYNMRGFHSGFSLVHELCNKYSIIAIQEHWLRLDELYKLGLVSDNFEFSGISGMNEVSARGLRKGRPFGGVAFLWHKSLANQIEFIRGDKEGRCIVIKVKFDNRSLLLINVYLPCADGSIEYKNELGFYVGFISNILETIAFTDCVIMGDFNFELDSSKCGYQIFKPMFDQFNMCTCTDIKVSTYVNDELGKSSCIDHFIATGDLRQAVESAEVLDMKAINFSDHNPIVLSLKSSYFKQIGKSKGDRRADLFKLRWDKGDLSSFYSCTGELLRCVPLLKVGDNANVLDDLNCCYARIVASLKDAEVCTIPRIHCSALKPFWNDHLDALKHDSIFWHSIWVSMGRPQSGHVYQIKRSTKFNYKLAIRQAFFTYERQFDDKLYEHFFNKKMPQFWKTWSKKFSHNVTKDVYINGCNDGTTVANAFAKHFSLVYQNASVSDDSEIEFLLDSLPDDRCVNGMVDLVTVELVEKCVHQLQLGKACGPDDLSAEHFKYAHPLIIVHLCALFRAMLATSVVPDAFGSGIVIPLIKDKIGNVNSLDNYRGITLIPVVAKVFELVVLELCKDYLLTDDLQVGFKAKSGCANALFALRMSIDYFRDRHSTVYAASLDIRKAFDSVNHFKLFRSVSDTGFPKSILALLINWYSKLMMVVRWKGFLSNSFLVRSGVRQGSILSPSLFSVFMNIFIVRLKTLGTGCCISGYFLGCFLYADDIILLSASVSGLQSLLNCCYDVSQDVKLAFNCSKSCCFSVGRRHSVKITDMALGPETIAWCDNFKYLGISFRSGPRLYVDTDVTKRKFFTACNSIFGNCRSTDELIQLQLLESYCFPLLQYAMCALRLTATQRADLNSCWNSVYRRIFNFRKFDSVTLLIRGLGRLDFKHTYIFHTLKFIKNCLSSTSILMKYVSSLFLFSGYFVQLCMDVGLAVYDFRRMSLGAIRCVVLDHFLSV